MSEGGRREGEWLPATAAADAAAVVDTRERFSLDFWRLIPSHSCANLQPKREAVSERARVCG